MEILRSENPQQTREDVIQGLHGMGVFRIDYLGQRWMLGFEVLKVDVDIEKVTAPSVAPKAAPLEADQPPAEPSPEEPSPQEQLPTHVADELSAIDTRVGLIQKSIAAYAHATALATMQKFGFGSNEPHIEAEELMRSAEHLRDLVAALPELYLWKPQEPAGDEDASGCQNASESCYEKLRESLRGRSLVIVGGVPIKQRLDELENILGIRPEWPETTQDGNMRVAESLFRRMREGKIGAIIIADSLIRHNTFYMIRDSAASYGVPLAYAAKAGIGKLKMALEKLEEQLTKNRKDS